MFAASIAAIQSLRTVHTHYLKCGCLLFCRDESGSNAKRRSGAEPRTTLCMPNGVANFSKLGAHER
jgi:hypothetical protein